LVKLKIPAFMKDAKQDIAFMDRCLELALKGLGNTAPNPMVGCVLVAGGKIIGQGYHREFSKAHAEVNAIQSVKSVELLASSTLYVNLEPCSHHGNTPPCSGLILDRGIPRVVVGTRDPNKVVTGKGITLLRDHGVEVSVGIMEKECLELNRRFFTYHGKNRPYIILKWAETKDGFIDHERTPETPGGINWITGTMERQLVHKWRSEEQAILVGTRTALTDDPELTVRDWSGRQPLRLVIDRKGKLPGSLKLLDGRTPTVIFSEMALQLAGNIRQVKIPGDSDMVDGILDFLYENEIQSLIVEGGRETLEVFIKRNLWDETRVFTGDQIFKSGIRAPRFEADASAEHQIGRSMLSIFRNTTTHPLSE
jgi:diaminohydroxyphosphoribosylaminopyrimidine deaminase/5-amino-6-(5-phosphoribosylamino)uracil reductase